MNLIRFAIRMVLSASGIPESILCACVIAELSGYWLHRLLHSEKVPWLSRSHMIHHLMIYGPDQPMRTLNYEEATAGRVALGNIGAEWLAPSAVVLGLSWLGMIWLRVPVIDQVFVLVTLVVWPFVTFSYLHDRMHLRNPWMARAPVVRRWFVKARRLHDIHHHRVNDAGRMDTNFGIGLHLFDRLFGTLATRHRPLNQSGFEAARLRYGLPRLGAQDPRSVGDVYVPGSENDGEIGHERSSARCQLESR